jgi:hypothetical protein
VLVAAFSGEDPLLTAELLGYARIGRDHLIGFAQSASRPYERGQTRAFRRFGKSTSNRRCSHVVQRMIRPDNQP